MRATSTVLPSGVNTVPRRQKPHWLSRLPVIPSTGSRYSTVQCAV